MAKRPVNNIGVTTRPELLALMAHEFHREGRQDFHEEELLHYLKRLHPQQIKLLNTSARQNHLTAFITFGDGCFDRLMAADFCDRHLPTGVPRQVQAPGGRPTDKLTIMLDNVRPNASLALFYRTRQKIDLVYYTRFFVVSYRLSPQAREQCRTYDSHPTAALRQQIFNSMEKMYTVQGFGQDKAFSHVSRPDPRHRYRFVINSVSIESLNDAGLGLSAGVNSYVPYIVLQKFYPPKWDVPRWMKTPGTNKFSVIHGVVNTKGCWMLTRNYLWNWPDENRGENFRHLVTCFLAMRAGDPNYLPYVGRYLNRRYRPTSLPEDFLLHWRNHAYHEFVRFFAGMHFNCHKDYVHSRPEKQYKVVRPPSGHPANTGSSFTTNLLESTDNFWQGEKLWFTSGSLRNQNRPITAFKGDSRTITVSPAFPRPPQPDDLFVLDNGFTPTPRPPRWGPNIFGQTFGFGQSWADVHLFRRSQDFTRDRGDRRPFD